MIRLTIETDSIANANFLAAFLRTVKSVKKVVVEKPSSAEMRVEESSEPYNWTTPSRPATDEEIEQLCIEMEAETDGIDAPIFFKQLKKKYKK